MSANISGGMVRLRYLGKKMSSIWTGMATGTEYVFGLDRQTGWVYTQDVGERGKSGLLNYKDSNGQWLFEQVSTNTSTKTTEPVQVSEPVAETKEAIVETENVATTEVDATAAQENVVTVPDPTDLNVEEIKRLQLDKAGWTEVYKIELAGRNRKGAITFIEEQIASFD